MIQTQYINLNMVPSGVMPVLYCSQYDVGRPLGLVVYNGGEAVDLSTYTCTIEATRSDGTAITTAVTTSGNVGAFATTATMTNQADKYLAKLVLFDSQSRRVASLAFVMCVTPKTMDENAESIAEDASLYQQYTGTVQMLIADIREDLANLSDHVDVVENALNSTPFHAERVFRHVRYYDTTTGLSNVAAQSMAWTGSTLLIGGRIGTGNTNQIINEYDLSGNLIRSMTYQNDTLGHLNDMTFDAANGLIYTAGTGASVVVLRYSDLSIIDTHAVSGTTQVNSVAYDNGVLYAGASGRTIGIIDMATWAYTPMITYSVNLPNQTTTPIRQTIAVNDGYIYEIYNYNNQILKFNIAERKLEKSIYVGIGNGTYPYGEIEGITFVNGQLYFSASVWYTGYLGGDYDGTYIQVFKSNIGGALADCANFGQAAGGGAFQINVNGTNTTSTSLNPNGSTDAPFRSIFEACVYINYRASLDTSRAYSLQIYNGNNYDYSRDIMYLNNVIIYIRGVSALSLKSMTLTNCVAFLRQMTFTEGIYLKNSLVRLNLITSAKVTSTYCRLSIGGSCTVADYDLEGTEFVPYSWDDITSISNRVTTSIMRFPYYTTTVSSEYLSESITLDRMDRMAVLSYQSTFTIPTNTRTTVATLPDEFKPVRNYVYDLIEATLSSKLIRIRVYLNTDGTLQFHNYDTEQSTFTNTRLYLPYITVAV